MTNDIRNEIAVEIAAGWIRNQAALKTADAILAKLDTDTRIAELENAYRAARDETYRMAVTATEAEARAEAAEAKLAKLTTIFGHIAGCSDHDSALRLARATLAQLKGTDQ